MKKLLLVLLLAFATVNAHAAGGLFESVRSVNVSGTSLQTGVALNPHTVPYQFTIVWTDSAPGNTLLVQVMLTDNTWATIQTITTTALGSGQVQLWGPFPNIRLVVSAHRRSGAIVGDIFALE